MAAQLTACAVWQPSTVPAPQLIQEAEPSRVRVTRTDGVQVVLSDPTQLGDSLVEASSDPDRSAVALSDIRSVEVRRISAARTGAFVLLSGVVVLAVVTIVVCVRVANSSEPCGG